MRMICMALIGILFLSSVVQAQTMTEKVKASELIGEIGAEKFAAEQGYTPIMTRANKGGIPQGFDQVYRNKSGQIVVIEAKGGTSMPNKAFIEDPIKKTLDQAKYLLKSEKASIEQKRAATDVLQAFKERRLIVQAVSTRSASSAPRLIVDARFVKPAISKSGIGKVAGKAGKLLGPIAIVVTVAELGIDAEQRFEDIVDIVTNPNLTEQKQVTKVVQKIIGFVPAQVPFAGERLEKAVDDLVEDFEYELYQGYLQAKAVGEGVADVAVQAVNVTAQGARITVRVIDAAADRVADEVVSVWNYWFDR